MTIELARLFGPPHYLFADNEHVRDDLLGMKALLEELFPVRLLLERLPEATAVSEKAFMRLSWFTDIVGIGDSSNSADIICDLEKPASIRVCIAVIGNVF